jgi:ABC-type hemin transport system ATPase subunit
MYKIEELILDGYKRLQLSQLDKFQAIFTERDQLIIGTNGSGKSSIFQELSPLPADSKQYEKTGKKVIKINKDSKQYTLTSVFLPKNHHSFEVNGEELNESGLVTIQKELVEKHFGITEAIHNLMIGKTSFTFMSVNERRQWFTDLSDANYEYLISVYLRYRDEVRDVTGALRLAKAKLVSETSKMMKEEELTKIRKEVETLYEVIEHLTEKRFPLENTAESLVEERDKLLELITNNIEAVYRQRNVLGLDNQYDTSNVEETLIKARTKVNLLKERELEYFKKHKEVSELFEALQKTKLENSAKLSTDINSINKEINKLKANKVFSITHPHSEEALDSINSIKKDLNEIVSNMEANPDKSIFNRETYQALLANINSLKETITNTVNIINKIETQLEHSSKHKDEPDLECPKCKHTWNKGFDEKTIKGLQENLKLEYIKKQELEAKLKLLVEDQERFLKYSNYLKHLKNIISYTKIIDYFWEQITEESLIELKPNEIANRLLSLENDLKIDSQINKLRLELSDKLKLAELAEQTKGQDYTLVEKTLTDLNNQIHQNNIDLIDSQKELEVINRFNNSINTFKEKRNELNSLLENINTNTEDILENFRRQAFNRILRDAQSLLASKEKILQDSNNQYTVIKHLNKEIEELTAKEKAYKIGLKVLSPTEGLIAKGLYGFMKIFIQSMNNIIAKIWSYPLVIYPCNASEDGSIDLTYKFPMMVNNEEGMRRDVSEGSSSMVEVVDLAFRICALKALKLDDSPLFLDEFGKAMDSVHRRATTNLIKTLMEEENFSQMFLISHDISQYGALSNCEVLVLNELNIILPPNSVYNKHVKMF